MSKRELGRVEVLARVRSKQLQVVDAGRLMRVSYRQAKRLWKRYREEGATGLKHRSAGRPSHRAHEPKFRRKVLQLVGRSTADRWANGLGRRWRRSTWNPRSRLKVDGETLRRWMLRKGCGVGSGSVKPTVGGASARSTLGSWCRWTGASTRGWRSAARRAV